MSLKPTAIAGLVPSCVIGESSLIPRRSVASCASTTCSPSAAGDLPRFIDEVYKQAPLRAWLPEPSTVRGSPRPADGQNRRMILSSSRGALRAPSPGLTLKEAPRQILVCRCSQMSHATVATMMAAHIGIINTDGSIIRGYRCNKQRFPLIAFGTLEHAPVLIRAFSRVNADERHRQVASLVVRSVKRRWRVPTGL